MGRKKKTFAPRIKQLQAEPAPPHSTNGAEAVPCTQPNTGTTTGIKTTHENLRNQIEKVEPLVVESDGSLHSSIKIECERALNALRRGNHTKALRVMKELCSRHENTAHSALIHRVQGTVCVKVASIFDDPNAKKRHMRNAVESAKKATYLSPSSIEFAHFYANLLYEAANVRKEYETVVEECERALTIENPVDPGKESLQEESQQKISTAYGRINHVQSELKSLIQKSNLASLSTWITTFGSSEKLRFIPIRRVTEDPMEVRLVQARRPNEIKKATKTQEERKKEIEVRVAAARLLQQRSDSSQLQNEGDKNERGLDNLSGIGRKGSERRKYGNGRKNRSTADRRDWVRLYWNSIPVDMKKNLLKINVSDLKAHFGSSKDGLAVEILSEAFSFAETNMTWSCWVCSQCNEKFINLESHMQHVVQEHLGILFPKMQHVLPQSVENEWVELLLKCSWKPLDILAAVKMYGSQPKNQDSELDKFYSHTEEYEDCFKDAWDSSLEKDNLDYVLNCSTVESNDCKRLARTECKDFSENPGSIAYALSDGWPISHDSERAKLLERIYTIFELLTRHKYLARGHLNKVIQFTTDELQNLASGSQLLNHGVDQTPICICFLGASQLKKIVKFLQELSHSCGLGTYFDKTSSVDDAIGGSQAFEVKEKIVLSGDASCILLDERLLSTEYSYVTSANCTADRGTVTTCSTIKENGIPVGGEGMLSWIFAGPSSGEQLALWTRTKEEKTNQALEVFMMLEKEFDQLKTLCERKCEHLNYEEALQTVEDLCLEEGKKREALAEFVHQSYESVLKKRREQLTESENDATFISSRSELDALSNVLKEAEGLNLNQFGYEETYAGVSSQLCDLESGEDSQWITKDYLHQVDTCIEVAIQRQKEHISLELSKIDTKILRSMMGMKQLELKLEPFSAYDYRFILLPMVKSYLRTHLEDLAERDATEKSDAAREAFLAELALDSKKGVQGGADRPRYTQDKSKDKKKSRDFKKIKDLKATDSNGQRLLNDETAELNSFPVSSDDDLPNSVIVLSVKDDDLKQQEEDFRRKIEFEAEERKLEETLEYQRQIENEAKQKHLAEQHKKTSWLAPLVSGDFHNVYLEASADGLDVHDLQKPGTKERLVHKNGFQNKSEAISPNSSNGVAMQMNYSSSFGNQKIIDVQSIKVKQALPNGGTPEAGVMSSEQQSVRKSSQQKISNKSHNGKYQTIPFEKEKTEPQNLRVEGHAKEQIHLCDCLSNCDNPNLGSNRTKTLRQLHKEDGDEERFQADLKKAVRHSLDSYQARQKPLMSTPHRTTFKINSFDAPCNEVTTENINGADLFGIGLTNDVGEYNCFLNVIIQSLWHLRWFRDEFLKRSTLEHVHIGDHCVVCALYDIFTSLDGASIEKQKEAVAPTALRMALSNVYPESKFFQKMNDASEVLETIFHCLHQSFAPGMKVSDTESGERNCKGSWDCGHKSCIVHSLFSMNVLEQMHCQYCCMESKKLKYTSFLHNINANALRKMKVICPKRPFDELMSLVQMNHHMEVCDRKPGGCGKSNYMEHILSNRPHIFTTVLGWKSTSESAEDIAGTLASISTEIDISVLYRGIPKNKHSLVSVVCYYGQHYQCFVYNRDRELWLLYDDRTVKVIGGWANVLSMCERGHLQPQVLFYEAVN